MSRGSLRFLSSLVVVAGAGCIQSARAAEHAPSQSAQHGLVFEQDIVPILKAYCWHCHGGEARKGGLDLRTLPLMLRGGYGGPAIVRGSAKNSLLFRKFPDLATHPPASSRPTPAHIETLRAWIDGGARASYENRPLTQDEARPPTAEDHRRWAFQTPRLPKVPPFERTATVRTPIDAFILQKLSEHRLAPAEPADRVALIRRTTFDVIGLPPTPQEIDRFVADGAPDAYERLIDRLLASPHYGERWGRHWLDAAGYVDTRGTDNDANLIEALDGIWKYRDYVIAAFNDNRPYDRFLREQLAGDEMLDWQKAATYSAEDRQELIATGFLRLAADVTWAPELNTSDIRHQVLFDTVQIVSTNLMGLTVHCAQCHSHKFDPIPQADYYRMAGLFLPAYDPQNWRHSKERTLFDVPPRQQAAIDAQNASVDRQVAVLQQEIARLRKPVEDRLRSAKLLARKNGRAPVRLAAASTRAAAGRRKSRGGQSAEIPLTEQEIDKGMDAKSRIQQSQLRARIAALQKTRKAYGTIQALWDLGAAPPAYLYRRGDFRNPGPQVEPGVLQVLDDPQNPFRLPNAKGAGEVGRGTGYRTAFARWLSSKRHPLTARVFVNRVWMHHFGRGIVPTPDNFGASGLPPSHPELLDWLARDFISSGFNVKRLHRLILTSAVYRQSSVVQSSDGKGRGAEPTSVDPENTLLWKMPLRRNESEIVRDAILSASGTLDERMGGPPVPLKPNSDGSVEIDRAKLRVPSDAGRRSIYLFARRNYHLTELGAFDQPVVATNCTCRTSSAVVSQSLALLNGRFALDSAHSFAQRVERIAPEVGRPQIETAYRLALGRLPSPEELTISADLLRQQAARYSAQSKPDARAGKAVSPPPDEAALTDLCQMLFNSNEFLYAQ